MKARRGSRASGRERSAPGRPPREPKPADDEAAARARVEALFAALDRLTPDELARLGLRPADDASLAEARRIAERAAAEAGRGPFADEVRTAARDAVLRRFGEGQLRPTWVGLNWGQSLGTAENRAAIATALADAALGAVVEDVVERDVAEALELDALRLARIATGDASEGSLDRPLRTAGPTRGLAILVLALILLPIALLAGSGAGAAGVLVAAVLAVAIVLATARALRARGDR